MITTFDLNTTTAGNGNSTPYTEQQGPAILFGSASLVTNGAGNNKQQVDQIVLTISNPSSADSLALNATAIAALGSGTWSYNSATGVLTINAANLSDANWTTVLNNITYQNTSDTPPATRTINVVATDVDNSVSTTARTETVNITAVNDPPTGSATAVLAHGTEDTAYVVTSAQLLQGFTDPEGNALSVTGLAASNGTVTQNGNNFTITPAANFNGTMTLNYTVSDGHGGTVAGTQSFVLDPTNDAPALTGSQATLAHGTEDTPYGVTAAQLLQGFTDIDGDTLSPANLSVNHGSIASDGLGGYTITPAANYNGPITISYQVSDGHGGSVNATLGLTLDPANDAPTNVSLSPASVAENSAGGTVVGTVTSTDPDSGDSFTYALLDDAGGRFVIDANSGVVSVADGALLDREAVASYDITVQTTDAGGLSFSKSLTIALGDVNDNAVTAPVDNNAADNQVNENAATGTLVGITAHAVDPDVTPTSVTYSLADSAGGRFQINATTGVVTVANGALLNFEDHDSYDIIVRATSADGSTANQSFTIAINDVQETLTWVGTGEDDVFIAPYSPIDGWIVDGKLGNDTITTNDGNDVFLRNGGNDVLSSGAGDDVFQFVGSAYNNGYDTIDGGDGYDRLVAMANNTTIVWHSLANVEEIDGNGFAFVNIEANDQDNYLDFSNMVLTGINLIKGVGGNDVIIGSVGDDRINGGGGNDSLFGGLGNDTFIVAASPGVDSFDGGDGFDTIAGGANGAKIQYSSLTSIEMISSGGFTNVQIVGTAAADAMDLAGIQTSGIALIDLLGGDDHFAGSDSDDIIRGNTGADTLAGGLGADTFVYKAAGESKGAAADLITDFVVGVDKIDLNAIDANGKVAGNQDFNFIGDSAFHHVAGELRIDHSIAGITQILADMNGDGIADLTIKLSGDLDLSGSDFLL